ncbi:hypothetical protein QOZ96_003593 [Brevundimonas nasdae]|uniref:DnaT-like ssDNA-binding protein n=1 Tax=Brevundimonas nasdae TaxID=172043 RepID=UPI001914A1A4|nr:DnaT-like ssDNA-binding protein [Brevundimonas nasdae]MBK6024533.1 hypothetical protein [Brevundimonas nasdae]MDQ0453620.1 hypothetical protein [Brevundimonas nasdae]
MSARGSDEGLAAWMDARGYSTSLGDLTPAQLRQRATDYIDGLYGTRIVGDQTSEPLRTALEYATYAAALHESANPGSLAVGVTAAGALKRKKIDTIEKEYFEGSGNAVTDNTLRLSAVEGLLAPFLIPDNSAPYLGLWAVG